MNKKLSFSYISNAEGQYIDSLYESYLLNPEGVDSSWQKFFEGLEFGLARFGDEVSPELQGKSPHIAAGPEGESEIFVDDEIKVLRIILAYQTHGHLMAKINPLYENMQLPAVLQLATYGLGERDLLREFCAGHLLGLGKSPLKVIVEKLRFLYCGNISIEYRHIEDLHVREWIRESFEALPEDFNYDMEKRKRILSKLNEAAVFENFLQTKFIGQKRFSLEGGENTIPAIDAIINTGVQLGVEEVVIGMAHRGRLNVLANIIGKNYEEIFSEFSGKKMTSKEGDGDVKYHLGHQSTKTTPSGQQVHLKLMPNPSHLEAVGPVVQGYARAKAEILYKCDTSKVLPIQIHGDAAVAGQGVIYEALQMSQLEGYATGGTIHFVINNQIGFTTIVRDARSSTYCTNIGKILNIPILHVNGDDAESVVHAVELATRFRQQFKRDVFIDMVCYRKYGHNESDEPRYTQPQMYDIINQHPGAREVYLQKLLNSGKINKELAEEMQQQFRQLLQDRFNLLKQDASFYQEQMSDIEWKSLRYSRPKDFDDSPDTHVPKETLDKIMQALTHIPPHLHPIPKAVKVVQDRKVGYDKQSVDWALAELLSYGSLLLENHYIRLSGQDAIRGTFSHRHVGIFDQKSEEVYLPVNHIEAAQAVIRVYNSPLSEYAVLGFEYGYSLGRPNNLTIWEAQFGDFSNGAQTIIDQFISSAESKWSTRSGIVLLLPHGYEGQGPEHSSARAERFLQLCAEFNMIVANCTTPANFFHILRRQLKYEFRKPLVVLTPKSLLRHPLCVSPLSAIAEGKFAEIIDDSSVRPAEVKRVLLCTGKVYYDLFQKQQQDGRKDVAIIRLEQLHPIPFDKVDQILAQYKNAHFIWVQEEPKNMGFWNYILRKLDYYNLEIISRKSSASPATGHLSVHQKEQQGIVDEAFDLKSKK